MLFKIGIIKFNTVNLNNTKLSNNREKSIIHFRKPRTEKLQ